MTDGLTIETDQRSGGECTLLHVTGPVTLGTLFPLQSELRAQSAGTLVLDLVGVPYVDSAGLGCFVNAHVSAQRRGGKFVLVGVNQRVQSLLEMTRVHQVLDIRPEWQF